MNSLQIQYFLTVTEQKSFTEAARILFITQPAISKQIRLLEQELGAVLFERGKKNSLPYLCGPGLLRLFYTM